MIRLQDALVTDSLPDIIGKQPWAKAMAKAINIQMAQLITYAQRAQLYAAVNTVPEDILDAMALDIGAPGYSYDYPVETKRALVKTSLSYWEKAGTKAAVEDLCREIFGDAQIVEWFDYADEAAEPFHFKVVTSSPTVTEATTSKFRDAINGVKRLSAWLDTIELAPSALNYSQYYGAAVSDTTKIHINM